MIPDDLQAAAYTFAIILLALAIGLVAHGLVFRALQALARRRGPTSMLSSLLRRITWPTRLAAVVLLLAVAARIAPVAHGVAATVAYVLELVVIALVGWGVVAFINVSADLAHLRYRLDVEDNLLARKRMTHIRILQRAAIFLTVLVTIATMLMTNATVRSYGVSLFASAGVAGLVVGLAAGPMLSNLIAGIQIAFTQPIRIDDVVIVEGEWGSIEEITSTYVVVRIWDLRRLVVPLRYFIENPFQNWTHKSAAIIGSVLWRVDYTIDVDEVRDKVRELVTASPHWDGQVVNLQVTACDNDSVELRALMSARTSSLVWDLRCEIREKLLAWLQATYPDALPRHRIALRESAAGQG